VEGKEEWAKKAGFPLKKPLQDEPAGAFGVHLLLLRKCRN